MNQDKKGALPVQPLLATSPYEPEFFEEMLAMLEAVENKTASPVAPRPSGAAPQPSTSSVPVAGRSFRVPQTPYKSPSTSLPPPSATVPRSSSSSSSSSSTARPVHYSPTSSTSSSSLPDASRPSAARQTTPPNKITPPRGVGGAGLTQCFQNPQFFDDVVHLLDDVAQHPPHAQSTPPPLLRSSPSPPSPIAHAGANASDNNNKLNTSNPCDESFDLLESADTSLDATIEVQDETLDRRDQQQQQQQQHVHHQQPPTKGSDLYAAISQSFFHRNNNDADVGARAMQLDQCLSSSQNIDEVPMQEVFSQLEAAFPHRGNNIAPSARNKKVTPPSSGGDPSDDRSSADLLDTSRSPTASAVLPVLPVRSSSSGGSPNNYDTHDLRYWGIPDSVCHTYAEHGVGRLYDWQVECLSQEGVMDGRNLVYSAPTSGGKTMVSEVLMLRTLLQRKKKAIFILPFVSVVAEKADYLSKMFKSMDICVHGFYANKGGPFLDNDEEDIDIAVCTIEKANNLLNRLLEEDKLDEVGIIVIDEVHMMGDTDRGYLLELMVTKLLYAKADEGWQIVGMSATIPNTIDLQRWLNAAMYVTDFRPVPLQEFIKIENKVYDTNFDLVRSLPPPTPDDADQVGVLCSEVIASGHSALVFCPTRKGCEKSCEQMSRLLRRKEHIISDELRKKRALVLAQLAKTPAGMDPTLEASVPDGVAYHHAGLTVEEREIIEGAFRKGVVSVLMATSTLAAGVNLPARRVIFRSAKIGMDGLDVTRYKQMAGRAGRTGIDDHGESYLIMRPQDRSHAAELVQSALPPLESCLTQERRGMMRPLIEVICSGVVETVHDIARYIRCTLFSFQRPYEEVHVVSKTALGFLVENEFIEWSARDQKYRPTKLAKACVASALSPEEGLVVFDELSRGRKNFVLDCPLHLVYHVTPVFHNIEPHWNRFLQLYLSLSSSVRKVADLVGVTERFLVKASHSPPAYQSMDHVIRIHRRFYAALILDDLINEVPFSEVTSKFGVVRGSLQSLQQTASTFAGMVHAFCQKLGWWDMELLISHFTDRLNFGVQMDILPLVQIPEMKNFNARALYNAGYRTVASIAQATTEEIARIVGLATPFRSKKQASQSAEKSKQSSKVDARIARVMIAGAQKLLANQTMTLYKSARVLAGCINTGSPNTQVVNPNRLNFQHDIKKSPVKPLGQGESPIKSGDARSPSKSPDDMPPSKLNNSRRRPGPAKGKAKKKVAFSPPERSFNGGPEVQADVAPLQVSPEAEAISDVPRPPTSPRKTMIDAGRPGSRLVTRSNETTPEKKVVADVPTGPTELVVDIDLPDDESMDERIKVDDTGVKVARTSPWLSRKRKVASGAEDSGETEGDEPQERTEEGNEPPRKRSPAKHAATERQVLAAPTGSSATMTSTTSAPARGLPAKRPPSAPPDKENVANARVPANAESRPEVKHGAAGVPTPAAAAAAPRGERTSPSKVMKQTSLFSVGITPSRGRRKSAEASEEELGSEGQGQDQGAEKKRRRRITLYDELNEVKADAEPLPYRLIPVMDDDVDGSGGGVGKGATTDDATRELRSDSEKERIESQDGGRDVIKGITFDCLIAQWRKITSFAFALQPVSPFSKAAKMDKRTSAVAIALCWSSTIVYYVPLLRADNTRYDNRWEAMREVLKLKTSKVICFDMIEALRLLLEAGIRVDGQLFDPRIAAWVVDPEDKCEVSLDTLLTRFNPDMKVHGRPGSPEFLVCKTAVQSWILMKKLVTRLRADSLFLPYRDLEMPLIPVMAKMEYLGVGFVGKECKRHKDLMEAKLRSLEKEAYALAGREFSLTSAMETGIILFDDLGIPHPAGGPKQAAFTKGGDKTLGHNNSKNSNKRQIKRGGQVRYGCSKDILKAIKDQHPLPNVVLEHRKLTALITKYIDVLPKYIRYNARFEMDRLHGTWMQTASPTGRLAVKNPNLQTIPHKVCFMSTGAGTEEVTITLRDAFLAPKGCMLLTADYSQLELRLMAHFSKDALLISTLKAGGDLFIMIASQWLGKDPSLVTKQERTHAKGMCYGILYGMGAHSLSEQLEVSPEEAAVFLEKFKQTYKGVNEFLFKTVESCRKKGYVETIAGRRRYFPEINSPNTTQRRAAERCAVNTICQGSAADLMKIAMINIAKKFEEGWPDYYATDEGQRGLTAPHLALQIHDELVIELPEQDLARVQAIVKQEMEHAVALDVPMVVNLFAGQRWGSLEPL